MSEETGVQVLFSCLMPAVRIAANLSAPLRRMKQLVELAYFHEARRRKLKYKEITDLMGISMPKVGALSRQLKDHFSQGDGDYELHRRIMRLLWAGPQSEARIAQYFAGEEEPEAVGRALERLHSGGRIAPVEGARTTRYRLSTNLYRQGEGSWMARLDGLNHFLRSVTRVIKARFFDEEEHAVVRTVSFRIRRESLPRLLALYERQVFPLVCELDAEAEEGAEEEATLVNLSMHWAEEDDL